ncbi:MAG: hypothetical protein IJX95_05205 [Lachnospiraceae bacterium]|nr:hypothetical protein [Lachnospiraceae bacterium]
MSVKECITPEQLVRYRELAEQKKKLRKKGSRVMMVVFIVSVIIGAILGFGIAMLEDFGKLRVAIEPPFKVGKSFAFIYLFAFLLYYYVTMVLHTIIHEGGHLIFGLLTGYRFLSFRVLSFTIIKKDGKLMRKKIKVPGTLGQCLMYPPEWKEDGDYPYVWYNLGGGLLNLVFCALSVPLFFIHSPLAAWAAGVFIFTGVLFGISNLLPMSVGIPNDGKNCLLCAKERENQKAFYAQLKTNAMLSDGAMLTDIPEELLCVGEGQPVNSLTAFPRLMKVYRHWALGEEEKAEACLTELEAGMDKLPVAFANTFDLERLYLLLLQETPVEEIAAYYAVLQPVFLQVKDISVLRVKYVYYLFLSDEERETVDWLARSKKGRLPKKLPKQKKPVTAEKIFAEMEKVYAKHPVIGEAELHMSMVRGLAKKSILEATEEKEAAETE